MSGSNDTQLNETLASLDKVAKELDQVQSEIDRLLQHQQWLVGRKKDLEAKATHLQSECQRDRPDVTRSDFPWSKKLHELKKSVFGVEEFRSLQAQTMNTTLLGQDCILVMPTGGGKSLCYQLPAIVNKGFTLVVSPLVSLMEDQTMALEQLNINASLLNAGVPQDRVKVVHQAMIDPQSKLKLLYVTPEKISKSKRFMAQLEKAYKKGLLARVAIDEVHCCSQWGHDFRPDYKILGLLKRQFSETPILGLTATATNSVLEDVKNILNIQGCVVYRASYNRANLFYQVRSKPSKHTDCMEEIVKLINGKFKGQSGIIYCFSRRETEKVASDLRTLGIRAQPYHSDIEASSRSAVHRRWKNNQIQVVVATVAFGMGIDKPDVRFIIHHSLSKSIENYYQESGRAGRDDKRADCIIFLAFGDIFRQSTMVVAEQTGLNKLYNMVRYCLSEVKCRRSLLASHFGERWDGKVSCNRMCDNCLANAQVCRVEIQPDCRDIYDILTQGVTRDQRMTANKVMDVMQGKTVGGIKIKKDGKVVKRPQTLIEQIVAHLLLEGYLKEDFHFTPYSTISYLIPGPKASHVQSSKDHPIILKAADPKGRRLAKSADEGALSKVTCVQSEKVDSPSMNTPGTSKRTSKLSRGYKEKRQANGEGKMMVIDLSDDSDVAVEASDSLAGKKRKLQKSSEKRRVARKLEDSDSDDDGGCMVIDDDDNANPVVLPGSSSSRKQSTQVITHRIDKKCGGTASTLSKTPKPKQDSNQTKELAKREHGALGKRKSEDCHDGTQRKNDRETVTKRHKVDATNVSSPVKIKDKLEKSKHDKKTRATVSKTSSHPKEGKGHSSKLSSGKSLNGSTNSGSELEEIHTVYSEQLASLELASGIQSDSEEDFCKQPKRPSKTHNKSTGHSKANDQKGRGSKKNDGKTLPTFSLSFDNSVDNVEDIEDVDDLEGVYCEQMKRLNEDDQDG